MCVLHNLDNSINNSHPELLIIINTNSTVIINNSHNIIVLNQLNSSPE